MPQTNQWIYTFSNICFFLEGFLRFQFLYLESDLLIFHMLFVLTLLWNKYEQQMIHFIAYYFLYVRHTNFFAFCFFIH